MSERLRGRFVGCPYHDDDYEACIQHGGQAPCDPPEGWRLVPLTPTVRMVAAGIEAYAGRCEDAYQAMLKAAPSPGKED